MSHHQRYCSQSCYNSYRAILCHTIGTTDDITGVIHNAHTQVLIYTILNATLHIKDHLHTGAHQRTQETAAAHILNQPTNQVRKPHIKHHHFPENPNIIHTQKEVKESQ